MSPESRSASCSDLRISCHSSACQILLSLARRSTPASLASRVLTNRDSGPSSCSNASRGITRTDVGSVVWAVTIRGPSSHIAASPKTSGERRRSNSCDSPLLAESRSATSPAARTYNSRDGPPCSYIGVSASNSCSEADWAMEVSEASESPWNSGVRLRRVRISSFSIVAPYISPGGRQRDVLARWSPGSKRMVNPVDGRWGQRRSTPPGVVAGTVRPSAPGSRPAPGAVGWPSLGWPRMPASDGERGAAAVGCGTFGLEQALCPGCVCWVIMGPWTC